MTPHHPGRRAWGPMAVIGLLGLVPACANSASVGTTEPVMRLEIKTKGPIEQHNTDLRYYVVLNTATMADALMNTTTEADVASLSIAAQAPEQAGLSPTTGDPAGIRSYGAWAQDKQLAGWELPFYLSGGSQPNPDFDPRRTRSYAGTVPLLPVTWTDYFLLSNESGSPQLTQHQHPTPVSDPSLILHNVRPLTRGQDWLIDGTSLVLFIPVKNLTNGDQMKRDLSPVSPGPGIAPPAAPQRMIMANFFTATSQGDIVDRWTLSNDDPGVRLRLNKDAQDQAQNFRPAPLNPVRIPSLVSAESVTFASYLSQMKQL